MQLSRMNNVKGDEEMANERRETSVMDGIGEKKQKNKGERIKE